MFFVVKVNRFSGSTNRPAVADKNGFAPVILVSYNGTLPEKARVISGTVAHRAGLETGKNYAIKVTMSHLDDQYGEQYQYDVVGEITVLEVATKLREFGQGVVQRNSVEKTPETTPATVEADKF